MKIKFILLVMNIIILIDGPVGRGSRPPSAVASSRSSYLEMLEPISAYFMMNMMLNVDHDALTCREQGCIVDLIYLILEQI